MTDVVAIEGTLGPDLLSAIRRCLDRGEAFAVLNPADAPPRRTAVLAALAPRWVESADGERSAYEHALPVEEGDGALVLTSGTSGAPKVAILTRAALEASATLTTAALQRTSHDQWFACLPAFHIGGLATLLRGELTGRSTIFGDPRDPDLARAAGATHVSVVRTLLARHAYDAYACVLLGGGRPPEERPANVVTTWGMTETGSGVVYDGRPLPGVRLALDGAGQLWVASPTLLRAYRHDATPLHEGPDGSPGWFATGDAATWDGDQLRVLGRMAYVINTGGEKVWPEDIEVLIGATLTDVDVAIRGEEDAEWGQRVVCCVTRELTENEQATVRETICQHHGAHAVPKAYRVVTAIPRTANGKIARHLLD
jgi:o-succinylbenzoate---CoA ligase